ncbi:MAG TPA: hypothetical protein VFF11_04790, partial [Candidatus Binatia bacterium]|nr:hypothetical protein [Candidatus Binatia bacterium]
MKTPFGISVFLAGVLVLLLGGAAPGSAAVNSIGINFNQLSGVGNMQPADLAGAPGARTNNWNNLNSGGGVASLTSVQDSSGIVIPNMMATLYPRAFSVFGTSSSTATNEDKLYGSAVDTMPDSATENRLEISGIPYTNYVIFGYRSVEGTVSAPRAGYFSIRDVGTNTTYITNLDLTVSVTNFLFTNFVSTVWISGPNPVTPSLSNPANTGSGYVISTTTTQPTDVSQIQAGNYGVLPGDPNPAVGTNTYIDMTALTTNVNLTTNNTVYIYMTPVGNGLRGVAGGDTVQRFKPTGIQVVQIPTATLTNIGLSPVPYLLAGNPGSVAASATGQYADGATFPLNVVPGTTFVSQDTNIFAIDPHGSITP